MAIIKPYICFMGQWLYKTMLGSLCIMAVFFYSCKKNDVTNTGDPSANNIHPCFDTSFYGRLTFSKFHQVISSSTQSVTYAADAYFNQTPATKNISWNSVYVDSVYVGGVALALNSSLGRVGYNLSNLPDSLCTWHVFGANGIPSFTYNCGNKMPIYRDYNLIPDTIDYNKNFNLPINIMNASSATLTINNVAGLPQVVVVFNPPTTTSINLTVAQMLMLPMGYHYIEIDAESHDIESVYGKVMDFRSQFKYYKAVYFN